MHAWKKVNNSYKLYEKDTLRIRLTQSIYTKVFSLRTFLKCIPNCQMYFIDHQSEHDIIDIFIVYAWSILMVEINNFEDIK